MNTPVRSMRFPARSSTALATLGLLFLIALATRVPFFFPAVIDWDESTYVLIGQSILDGHLPYVELWTLKPPLLFVFFASVLKLFGPHLVGIRLAGTLCVTAASFFVYLTARRWWGQSAAFLAAAVSIVAIALVPSGQATTTEIVLLPWFMGAVYVLALDDRSSWRFFWAGSLIAIATLVRLNTAFAVVGAGVFVLWPIRQSPAVAVRRFAHYCAGGLLIVALTCLPYVVAGETDILWKSLVLAPFAYSSSQNTALGNLAELSLNALGTSGADWEFRRGVPWLNAFMWMAGVLSLAIFWLKWSQLGASDRRALQLVTLLVIGTVWGMVTGGAAYPHYLIQLVPFAAMLTAALVHRQRPWVQRTAWLVAAALAAMSTGPILGEYETMLSHARRHEDLRYGGAYDIAEYLKRENPRGRPVYLLTTQHIAYWLANTRPPTRLSTHPSNIWKEYLVKAMAGQSQTTEDELRSVFSQRPEFVVLAHDDFEELNPRAWAFLTGVLASDYVLATEIANQEVYRRRS